MTAKPATNRNVLPRPFLKWVGGKRQLLPELLERIDEAGEFGRYHEPFIGGGALFFEMYRLGILGRKKAYLSDNNPRLIETYEVVRDDTDELIRLLKQHKAKNDHDYYYEVRANVPKNKTARAARIIYMNKTCYNGLYRENRKGLFNTPYGRYKNPQICDEENLHACAEALRRTRIDARHFDTVTKAAKEGDLVYFDPPYHPVSETASFTSYAKDGFGEDAQLLLHRVYRELDTNDVKALLSNSYTLFVRNLYQGFTIDEVSATRAINSRADRRGNVSEVLIRNF
jgi:DNA adenine methylase